MNYQQTWLHLPQGVPEPAPRLRSVWLRSVWLVSGLVAVAALSVILLLLP